MDIGEIMVSTSAPIIGFAGNSITLMCSAVISTSPLPPSQDVIFEWFFDPENYSLPSGVTVSNVTNSSNTYTSTLQFSPLLPSHSGLYTCQFGGNKKLERNTTVSVTNDCESSTKYYNNMLASSLFYINFMQT